MGNWMGNLAERRHGQPPSPADNDEVGGRNIDLVGRALAHGPDNGQNKEPGQIVDTRSARDDSVRRQPRRPRRHVTYGQSTLTARRWRPRLMHEGIGFDIGEPIARHVLLSGRYRPGPRATRRQDSSFRQGQHRVLLRYAG